MILRVRDFNEKEETKQAWKYTMIGTRHDLNDVFFFSRFLEGTKTLHT